MAHRARLTLVALLVAALVLSATLLQQHWEAHRPALRGDGGTLLMACRSLMLYSGGQYARQRVGVQSQPTHISRWGMISQGDRVMNHWHTIARAAAGRRVTCPS